MAIASEHEFKHARLGQTQARNSKLENRETTRLVRTVGSIEGRQDACGRHKRRVVVGGHVTLRIDVSHAHALHVACTTATQTSHSYAHATQRNATRRRMQRVRAEQKRVTALMGLVRRVRFRRILG